MKSLVLALSLAVLAAGLAPGEADARRLGGGGFSGMQRSMPARAPAAVPARPAQAAPTTPAGATAAAAAPKRSWLGPIAGLAAGFGLAALASHLGFGAEFGNILMLALLAVAAFAVFRFAMRRFGGASAKVATPDGSRFPAEGAAPNAWSGGASTAVPAAAGTAAIAAAPLPEGFDAAGFERIAKMIFVRMQAANDSGDIEDLRAFTTPEMFAAARVDLQDRGDVIQRTDVVQIDAEVLDVATEAQRQIVSVRFHGLIRETTDGPAAPFDEIWHLVKPLDGSREWAIAGIQQTQ